MPLLLAHLKALDVDRPSAQERLEDALGPDLTRMLVAALTSSAGGGRRSRSLAAA
jgi:hypothetical protein